MSEVLTIAIELRDPQKNKGTGSRVARRLRASGRVPAIIYGHKQTPQPISLHRDDVLRMLKVGGHVAQLQHGDGTEMVLVRDVQWDYLGKEIIHLDFARVSAEEEVETEIALDFHGTPVGLSQGGNLEVILHAVEVVCRATSIPDSLRVDVSGLGVDQGLHVRDLKLPEGVRATSDPDLLLVHVVSRSPVADTTTPEGASSNEPEVIGRKADDKDDDDKDKKK
jgi:large subunit ribosomal protein L25